MVLPGGRGVGVAYARGVHDVAMTERPEAPLVRVELPARGASGEPVDRVALVTLDRPQVMNALSFALLRELADALARLDDDPACGAIVIGGAGERAFAAGVDIRELAAQTPESLRDLDPFAVFERIPTMRVPVIAAVRGFALGGGFELALACDLIVASEDAQLGLPELGLGVIPGAGGTQRLPRAIGRARALELILTGRRIPADEAERLGLVASVVPAGETVQRALEVAARIAAAAPLAVTAAKAAVNAASALPLDEGIRLERSRFADLFATDDVREGMTAFLEKRPASWSGR
jgi:enoyl-CoA hydratase